MSLTETLKFFDSYRDAFNRLDGDAVAKLWHSCSGITDCPVAGDLAADRSDHVARLTWWPDDEPMRANHRALCELYRQADYGRADFDLEAHTPMGPAHAFAHVHWTLRRRDGSLLQQFHTGYQLIKTANGPKVLLAVAHQEMLSEMTSHAAH
jgi:hypothetical protein